MQQARRAWIVPAVLLLFAFGASGLADSGPDELPCVSGEPYEMTSEEEEPSLTAGKGVRRNRILLEILTRVT